MSIEFKLHVQGLDNGCEMHKLCIKMAPVCGADMRAKQSGHVAACISQQRVQ